MMMFDSKKRVNLDSPHFDGMKTDLNRYIFAALKAMDEKNMSAATIGLKIDIQTIHKTIKDDNAPVGQREALVPDITYKVALTLQAKADTKGNIVRSGHELIRDDDGSFYIVTTEEASGQLSMFNGYDELPDNADAEMEDDEDDE